MDKKVKVRGIEIMPASNQQALADFLLNNGQMRYGKLVAINAEKVILSEQDPALRQLLKEAEYNYADGISVVWAIRAKYHEYQAIQRIAGVDLWQTLMQHSVKYALPVFLLGGDEQVIAQTRAKLVVQKVNVVGIHHGYFESAQTQQIIEQIIQSQAKLVCVAMGSPKQEQFIQQVQRAYPQALYMGVGGSYDVFVGKVKRAPQIWQNLGLEWLYRLLKQPSRWRRQGRLLKFAYYYLTKQL